MSSIFALDLKGKVSQLSTDSDCWEPLSYAGIDFKKVSASQTTLWAVAADHQLYIYFYGSDAAIRRIVETYENERWNPIGGFCSKLLPTDRAHFSSKDGTKELPCNAYTLPSCGWQWDGAWQLETTLDGAALGPEGWSYAVDFPASYHVSSFFSACVRRRRWQRCMRFSARDVWSPVPRLHDDMCADPFIDVAVGGQQLPGCESGSCQVWAVTVSGAVLFRDGVGRTSPEGSRWITVPTPRAGDVCQVSCGPSGLLWATCWDGNALVRTGVSRNSPTGSLWCSVLPPAGSPLRQVSVGLNCVWAVATDKRVFFRNGVKGLDSCENHVFATGTGWLEMLSEMNLVSVDRNNQVLAIGLDRLLYLRSNVTSTESTGHIWRPLDIARGSVVGLNAVRRTAIKKFLADSQETSIAATPLSTEGAVADDMAGNPPLMAVGSPTQHDASVPSISGSDGGMTFDSFNQLGDWVDVTASGCTISPYHLPPWFAQDVSRRSHDEVWRQSLVDKLQDRSVNMLRFRDYDEAVERGSWLKSANCRWLSGKTGGWVSCLLELEMFGTSSERVESGHLSLYSSGVRRVHASLAEITCVLNTSKSCRKPQLSILTAQRPHRPLLLSFVEETDVQDWLDVLSSGCSQLRNLASTISDNALWACTVRGDLVCSDRTLLATEADIVEELKALTAQSTLLSENRCCASPFVHKLERGFSEGCVLTIEFSRAVDSSGFFINLQIGPGAEGEKAPDVMYHLNPRYQSGVVVHNSRLNECWGSEQRDLDSPLLTQLSGEILIFSEQRGFRVQANGEQLATFSHRADCRRISHVCVQGRVTLQRVHYDATRTADPAPADLYWRHVPAHLRQVEAAAGGRRWGVGYDGTCWIHTGDAHGSISDTRCFHTYENQRWNPLSGFSERGLPTDRYPWSDETGRVELPRESVSLPSQSWRWTSDWLVDFRTPDGVDAKGWQYAMDFPASYHSALGVKDFVRRRRWFRKCHLEAEGPWKQATKIKLADFSFPVDGSVGLWAVSVDGDVLYSSSLEVGDDWSTVGADQKFRSISCGAGGRVWAVAQDGTARLRYSVSADTPIGTGWAYVNAPKGCRLKSISAGSSAVWAIDDHNRLYWRHEVMPVFPEGTSWRHVSDHVVHVSCGPDNETWAVNGAATLMRRLGVCEENSCGSDWQSAGAGGWAYVSCRAVSRNR